MSRFSYWEASEEKLLSGRASMSRFSNWASLGRDASQWERLDEQVLVLGELRKRSFSAGEPQ